MKTQALQAEFSDGQLDWWSGDTTGKGRQRFSDWVGRLLYSKERGVVGCCLNILSSAVRIACWDLEAHKGAQTNLETPCRGEHFKIVWECMCPYIVCVFVIPCSAVFASVAACLGITIWFVLGLSSPHPLPTSRLNWMWNPASLNKPYNSHSSEEKCFAVAFIKKMMGLKNSFQSKYSLHNPAQDIIG